MIFGLKIQKHRERWFAVLKDRYKWNHVVRNSSLELKRCCFWISNVRYDEAGHSCQGHNGFGKIAALWAFKIENYRQEALVPKCVPQSIKNGFSLFGKSAQDQHRF